jgi:hypothetical protein
LDELDFLKDQLARLPTRAEVRWIALRLTLGALAAIVAVLSNSRQPMNFRGQDRDRLHKALP